MLPIATDTTPTASANGAPCRMRYSTSRPKPSVPSGCVASGGRSRCDNELRLVLAGVPNWPTTVAARKISTSTSPIIAGICEVNLRAVSRQNVRVLAPARDGATGRSADDTADDEAMLMLRERATDGASGGPSCAPDPRVGEAVQQVRHRVDGDHRDEEHGDERLRERIVSQQDRIHQQLPQSGPREHHLRDGSPAEQLAEVQAEHRQDRDERVAEG